MMEQLEQLEHCPFCGGKAKIQYGFPNQQGNKHKEVFVKCTVCNAKTKTIKQYPFTKWEDCLKTAICLWNRRTDNGKKE